MGGMEYKRHKETFGGDRCVYCLNCSNGFMNVYTCQNSSKCTLKYEQFTVCQLHLDKAVFKKLFVTKKSN